MDAQDMHKGGEDHESASKMEEETRDDESATPAKGWTLESVTIRVAENGGFIATCSRRRELPSKERGLNSGPATDYQSKDYAFSDKSELYAFLDQELSGGPPSARRGSSMPMPSAPSARD